MHTDDDILFGFFLSRKEEKGIYTNQFRYVNHEIYHWKQVIIECETHDKNTSYFHTVLVQVYLREYKWFSVLLFSLYTILLPQYIQVKFPIFNNDPFKSFSVSAPPSISDIIKTLLNQCLICYIFSINLRMVNYLFYICDIYIFWTVIHFYF